MLPTFCCYSVTQDAIKYAQQWFLACGPAAAAGLSRLMAMRCVAPTTSPEGRMHIVYLANDILFKRCVRRCACFIVSALGAVESLAPMNWAGVSLPGLYLL
jgi:hypothetical protein